MIEFIWGIRDKGWRIFPAGNLEPVARAIRRKWPEARMLIAADDDRKIEGNLGITSATKAAKAVGATPISARIQQRLVNIAQNILPQMGIERVEGEGDLEFAKRYLCECGSTALLEQRKITMTSSDMRMLGLASQEIAKYFFESRSWRSVSFNFVLDRGGK